jgi:hypothetical protein
MGLAQSVIGRGATRSRLSKTACLSGWIRADPRSPGDSNPNVSFLDEAIRLLYMQMAKFLADAPDGREARKQFGELPGRRRRTEVEALSFVTAMGLQECELLFGFHTFRDDSIFQALAHGDYGAHD